MSPRVDRYGDEQLEADDGPQPPHPDDCTGWAGDDIFGRPIPCARCKAETAERIARQRRRDWEGPSR